MSDNKLLSLSEIFNDKFFRIPDFQRGYSWGIIQLDDFWEDLMNLKNDKIHYTGLLTVEQVSKSNILNNEQWKDDLWLFERGFKAFYLIDGQQRLTTAIILINEILNFIPDDKGINFNEKTYWIKKYLYQAFGENYKSYIFGYERDNPSDEYFKTKILAQKSSSSDKVPEQTLYTANLKRAKEYFHKKLKNLDRDALGSIFKKINTMFKFNLYEIDDELDVYVTFETMNNRGKALSSLELLKNRLIYLSTLLEVNESLRTRLRKDINETWKTIYEYLGKNKDNAMDDDDFLRNHWIMYFKYDRNEANAYAKFLLNKKFTAKETIEGNVTLDDIKKYIDSLSDSVKSWFYISNPEFSTYTDETKEWLQKLNRVGMGAFPPLIMASMAKHDEEDFLLLLKAAERFIFLVFKLSQRSSNTQNNYFYRLANDFYFKKDDLTLQKVIEIIEQLTDGEDGEGDEYTYYGWFNLDKFSSYIKERFEKDEGYFSWNGLRYFLYEYELYLQKKAKGNQKVHWSDFSKRKKEDTIEHIYPQTPNDKCWKSVFDTYTKKEKIKLLHNLGNLVLLARSKNSELQNKCFDFKKSHIDKKGNKVGFFNGSYSEIEIASYSNWTPSTIKDRGEQSLDFLVKRWDIDFEGWETDKEDLLLLDFIDTASK
ncbi:DUF262 domain-containing protein [Sulfurimonas hydrogeniphila]|uniref:DUF262 domain-containing protein n=1 Tax=Sulfurimonas hydrogeniphila TaxID=2509341 RepID=UPI00125EF47E|nr:DUF262 domain-containing protein [Sulfurimonas hydrogeniphila]